KFVTEGGRKGLSKTEIDFDPLITKRQEMGAVMKPPLPCIRPFEWFFSEHAGSSYCSRNRGDSVVCTLSFGALTYPRMRSFSTELTTTSYGSRPTRNWTGSFAVRSFFSSRLSST